ncbi:hypothetical protein [Bdellovibrio reynosensis]|uniref:DUF1570 domain-containing protein n=1 Tax=Bdellovibrio reynosensis TaxID=2835041 RepID=A0ABY4C7G2_9BACT|nr:hypothetical protein [Bdellovibrio reynosensis]UOF00921.1 hypothetical protein MNR06_14560 [Bdellovibrio reynosensis]
MKRVYTWFIAAILCGGLLSACAPQSDSSSPSGSIKVLAPLNNSKGGYSLGIMELLGINDLQSLAGKFARFFFSPKVVDQKLYGVAPKSRFIRNVNGDYIPANEMTQQLVTIYGHIQNLALLDKELGLAGLLTYPRDVGVAVKVKGKNRNNNAFYDGKTDSMLFVPFTNQGLPIAVNGGILAHEHFHSLFYKLVLNTPSAQVHDRADFLDKTFIEERAMSDRIGMPADSDVSELSETQAHLYYHMALLRGMNEGLADFWGWMYTGDTDFISHSLPSEKSSRSLKSYQKADKLALPTEAQIKNFISVLHARGGNRHMSDLITGGSYSIGTSFARTMKSFTDVYAKSRKLEDRQARRQVAKLVIKVLPQMKKDFEQLGDLKFYSPLQFLKTLQASVSDMSEAECGFLSTLMSNSASDRKETYICKNEEGWKIQSEEKKVEQNKDDAVTESREETGIPAIFSEVQK